MVAAGMSDRVTGSAIQAGNVDVVFLVPDPWDAWLKPDELDDKNDKNDTLVHLTRSRILWSALSLARGGRPQ